jgi:hypothetical protein
MKFLLILISFLTFLPLQGLAGENTVPRLIDDDGPSQGVRTLDLKELWRVGGEDEDVIFGRIVDLIRHPNGEVYILDNQMCQVVVISGDGEHLRDLSRQGDGPGELRQPMGLVFLPDDVLGVGMGFPGKMVTLKLDGTPVDSRYPIGEPVEGNIGVMISLQGVDGVLVASGGRLVFSNEGESHTMRFLSVTDYEADNFNRILEKTTPMDPTGLRFVETDAYYIDQSWALGPQGKIYAPMKRDTYEVSVFDKTGKLLGEFGRKNNPRKRTRDDKDDVGPLINVAGRPEGRDWDISDHDECVSRILFNHAENTLWVLTPHGSNDQPEGILETWDVFGTDGEYLQQVAIPLGDEMNDGTCYLVGGGKLVVVKGTASSFDGGENPEDEEDETEVEPLEVICYEMR